MIFTTPVRVDKQENQISYESEILSAGSCFAVNMAEKFRYFQFRQVSNPLGILFHPIALETLFADAAANRRFTRNDIFERNGRWHCFDAHSDMSGTAPQSVLSRLNEKMALMRQAVGNASHIILTLGTAWAYRHKGSGRLVANCHKVPQSEFAKELLSVDQITESVARNIDAIRAANAGAQVIFTISPVRHVKDGLVENQRSKAHLISAVHEFVDWSPNVHYFPAYEIVMDELRDYRFYGDDMLHPSEVAIDFIWKRFSSAWISERAFGVMDEVDGIRKALAHRPFDGAGAQHQVFRQKLSENISALETRFPFMDFKTG